MIAKRVLPVIALVTLVGSQAVSAMELGISGWFLTDWNSEQPFRDLTLSSRPFVPLDAGDTRDYPHGHAEGIEVFRRDDMTLDENGYPIGLPQAGVGSVSKLYMADYHFHSIPVVDGWTKMLYPRGTYTLQFEGEGEVKVSVNESMQLSQTIVGTGGLTEATLQIGDELANTGGHSYIAVRITASSSSDHIRNIKLIVPDGSGGTSWVSDIDTDPWRPDFLRDMRPFSVFKFTDWMSISTSEFSNWDERTLVGQESQGGNGGGGISYDWAIAYANRMNSDIWINVPRSSTEDFWRGLCELIHDNLEPGRKVYLEWWNNPWSDESGQISWVNQQAAAAGISSWDQIARTYAGLWEVVAEVFGDDHPQIVNVMSGDVENVSVAENIMNAIKKTSNNPNQVMPNGLMILNYVYGGDQISQLQQSENTWIPKFQAAKTFADANGLLLLGGQGGPRLQRNTEANYGPEIAAYYEGLLGRMESIFDLYVHFGYCSHCESGAAMDDMCPGVKFWVGMEDRLAGKYLGLKAYAQAKGLWREVPDIDDVAVRQGIPASSAVGVSRVGEGSAAIMNAAGRVVGQFSTGANGVIVPPNVLESGVYFVHTGDGCVQRFLVR